MLVSTEAAASPLSFEFAESSGLTTYASTEKRDNGTTFNREKGLLVGPSLDAAASWGPWRLELVAGLAVGTVGYEGQTQLGLPIASDTRLRDTQLGASSVYRVGTTPLFLGASLRSRRIDRRIAATPLAQGLHETLNEMEVGPLAGARWQWGFGLGVALRAEVLWTFHSTLDVDFEGAYDDGHLALPNHDAERAALEVSYLILPDVEGVAEGVAEVFRPGRSNTVPLTEEGVPVGVYVYPGSVQEQGTVSLGLRARF
jgi:hypothetical protein